MSDTIYNADAMSADEMLCAISDLQHRVWGKAPELVEVALLSPRHHARSACRRSSRRLAGELGMTLTAWHQQGYDHATNNHPYNPPAHGPIFEAYTAGYDEGSHTK